MSAMIPPTVSSNIIPNDPLNFFSTFLIGQVFFVSNILKRIKEMRLPTLRPAKFNLSSGRQCCQMKLPKSSALNSAA